MNSTSKRYSCIDVHEMYTLVPTKCVLSRLYFYMCLWPQVWQNIINCDGPSIMRAQDPVYGRSVISCDVGAAGSSPSLITFALSGGKMSCVRGRS